MLIRLGFFATLFLVGAVFVGAGPAKAQSAACTPADLGCRIDQLEIRAPGAASCQPNDLACRVSALEARVTALEGAPHTATAAAAAAPPRVVYVASSDLVSTNRACRTDCRAEATAFCTARGYNGGAPEAWDRPRTGPVMMTRARCMHAQ